MSSLPASLRLGGTAVERLPVRHSFNLVGSAGAPDQFEEPGRMRSALRWSDYAAARPLLQQTNSGRGCFAYDNVRPNTAGNDVLRLSDRRDQFGADSIGGEPVSGGVDLAPERVADRQHECILLGKAGGPHQEGRR